MVDSLNLGALFLRVVQAAGNSDFDQDARIRTLEAAKYLASAENARRFCNEEESGPLTIDGLSYSIAAVRVGEFGSLEQHITALQASATDNKPLPAGETLNLCRKLGDFYNSEGLQQRSSCFY